MASYKERKSEPLEIMSLDGYTVDYCEPQVGESKLKSAFKILKNCPWCSQLSSSYYCRPIV